MLAATSLSSSMVFRGSLQQLSSRLRGTLIVYGTSRLKPAVIGTGHDQMSEISASKSRPHFARRDKKGGWNQNFTFAGRNQMKWETT